MEFSGGALFQFSAPGATSGEISRAVSSAGIGQSTIQQLGLHHTWAVQMQALTAAQASNVENALHHALGIPLSSISPQLVGPTWGSDVTSKAAEALIIFLVVIVVYLSIAFERKMAVAALVALLHDIMIAIGVYALVGFQVSPTTVIGLLTILGYSLYDTVVVFDKVRENTAGLLAGTRSTYGQAANLALNQTLIRSLNTSLTALVPVASILFVGSGLLGAGPLKDLSLVLFVGMLSGAYSSIFIATPVLVGLKEREPRYQELAKRVTRRQKAAAPVPAAGGQRPAGRRSGDARRRVDRPAVGGARDAEAASTRQRWPSAPSGQEETTVAGRRAGGADRLLTWHFVRQPPRVLSGLLYSADERAAGARRWPQHSSPVLSQPPGAAHRQWPAARPRRRTGRRCRLHGSQTSNR